ncbi:porin [Bythopirellula polymerisocia]|uniref:Phosphate-selective porin O and P n=1 Tax=Bythopirellula polymerisocia TaxID=2528003 RepID=A0A5C6CSJ5_9BACT|nr:porin [Bythopirellula polymerisocia]TWU26056.1 Phosphate-selective porin O and P [Bythopirellula polymerisocia]
MKSSFAYQRIRWTIALGLAALGGWFSTSSAQEFVPLPALAETVQEVSDPLTAQQTSTQIESLGLSDVSDVSLASYSDYYPNSGDYQWFTQVRCGYDNGFVLASERDLDLGDDEFPFVMRLNGWGQLRHTTFESEGANPNQNQFQLKRARIVFSGSAFTPDFEYFVQLDGRSSSGDNLRLLDYYMTYDVGHHRLGYEKGTLGFKTGKYKIPFSLARYLSGREFEFTDRSMASMYFDANRSLAWGLYGTVDGLIIPWHWETAIFNGLVTGGAETGSSGQLDDNFAYSARAMAYPIGEWGYGELADFEWHETLATRVGAGWANSAINKSGSTEFDSSRVVDSGQTLASILPANIDQYTVNLYSINHSCKWRGWSQTFEYYFRNINDFEGGAIPDLFDHGFWFQLGKFIVPGKLELLSRWSRVDGNSGTLGVANQSSEEIAGGFAWYIREQNAKLTADATYINGAPIDSASLDMSPGDIGWLFRSQIQFAF